MDQDVPHATQSFEAFRDLQPAQFKRGATLGQSECDVTWFAAQVGSEREHARQNSAPVIDRRPILDWFREHHVRDRHVHCLLRAVGRVDKRLAQMKIQQQRTVCARARANIDSVSPWATFKRSTVDMHMFQTLRQSTIIRNVAGAHAAAEEEWIVVASQYSIWTVNAGQITYPM